MISEPGTPPVALSTVGMASTPRAIICDEGHGQGPLLGVMIDAYGLQHDDSRLDPGDE